MTVTFVTGILNMLVRFIMLALTMCLGKFSLWKVSVEKCDRIYDMVELVLTISCRIAKYLEKVGLVQRDIDNSYLNLAIDFIVKLVALTSPPRLKLTRQVTCSSQGGDHL